MLFTYMSICLSLVLSLGVIYVHHLFIYHLPIIYLSSLHLSSIYIYLLSIHIFIIYLASCLSVFVVIGTPQTHSFSLPLFCRLTDTEMYILKYTLRGSGGL